MLGRRLLHRDELHSPYRSGRRTNKRKVKRADQRRAQREISLEAGPPCDHCSHWPEAPCHWCAEPPW